MLVDMRTNNKKYSNILEKEYYRVIKGLKNSEITEERIDTYVEVMQEIKNMLGEIALSEYKYEITGEGEINEITLEFLDRIGDSGYISKLKRDIIHFIGVDWINKYTTF